MVRRTRIVVSLGRRIMARKVVFARRVATAVAACFWLMAGLSVASQDLASQRAALKEIRETAADICYTVEQKGQQSEIERSGEVKAKLNGVAAKFADLGIEGSARLKSQEYQGIIQQELAMAISHSADCKKAVFIKLVDLMFPKIQGTRHPPTQKKQDPETPPPLHPTTDKEGFALTADGRRICRTETHNAEQRIFGDGVEIPGRITTRLCRYSDGTWQPDNIELVPAPRGDR